MKTLEAKRADIEFARHELRELCRSNGNNLFKYCDKLTDIGAAERFAILKGNEVRHCEPWEKWLIWDGKHWKIDDVHELTHLTKEVTRYLYFQAAKEPNDKRRSELINYVLRSESAPKVRAMHELLKAEVPVTPDQLDKDPWLLNLQNGTVNLKTGELQGHGPKDLITKLSPVEFKHDDTNCPTWHVFLERIFNGNESIIAYLKRLIGYCLTGQNTEQILVILWGLGANGKSTLINLILYLLGEYALHTPIETLLIKKQEGISNDIARLKGSRFVSSIESESGKRLAESLIKQLTGGDKIVARFLFGEFFEFYPTFKIFLATNHKPIIRGTDHAIWRRIRLIPFTVTIPEEEQDKEFIEKLKAEAPAILNWVLTGCLDWQQAGLNLPDEVKAATENYRLDMDILGGFLEECCIFGKKEMITNKELYPAYNRWADENKERIISQKAFSLRLEERGLDFYKDREGKKWLGIGLKT